MLTDDERERLRVSVLSSLRPGHRPKLTPEQREQLVRDYLTTPRPSVSSLARRYGISPQAAHYLIRKAAGLPQSIARAQ